MNFQEIEKEFEKEFPSSVLDMAQVALGLRPELEQFKNDGWLSTKIKDFLRQKLSQVRQQITSEETRKKLSVAHIKDDIGYYGIHARIKTKLGKPTKCSNPNCKSVNTRRFHWASISREAKVDPSDYISLCPSCHKIYDIRGLTLEELFNFKKN